MLGLNLRQEFRGKRALLHVHRVPWQIEVEQDTGELEIEIAEMRLE